MLKKGLIKRRRTRQEERAYSVKVPDEGSRLLKIADPLADRVDDRILASLPVARRERFMQDLRAIVLGMGRATSKRPLDQA